MPVFKFLWGGEVRRRRQTTLDIDTGEDNEPAIREVLLRLHPDRRPSVLVTRAF